MILRKPSFEKSKQIDGKIILDVHIDTDACYIVVGIDNGTDVQIKSLKNYLQLNKIKYEKWFESEIYVQLDKYDIFESEEVVAKSFKKYLNIILKS